MMNINELKFDEEKNIQEAKEEKSLPEDKNNFFCFQISMKKQGKIELFVGFLFMLIGFAVTLTTVVFLLCRFIEKLL